MRILVTGGAGFIGSTIVDTLVDDDHDVVVVDALIERAHRRPPSYLNPRATYITADLADTDVATAAVQGIDAVCHQASLVGLGVDFGDVVEYVDNNDRATAALLKALHDRAFTGRIVLAAWWCTARVVIAVAYTVSSLRPRDRGRASTLRSSSRRARAVMRN